MDQVRVALADDDARVRDALVDLLEADGRFEVVGQGASGEDALRLASEAGPAVVLVDGAMPGGGAEAARRLRALPNPPAVVVVSANVRQETVIAALRAGARGYLAKGDLGTCLPEMVRRCAAGQVHLAVPHADRVMTALLNPARRDVHPHPAA